MNFRLMTTVTAVCLFALIASTTVGEPTTPGQAAGADKKPVTKKTFSFEMLGLCCDKTTEQGADEIYFLLSIKYSNGTAAGMRLPGDFPHDDTWGKGHWDMNDDPKGAEDPPSGDAHCIGMEFRPRPLYSGELAPGESVTVTVFVMEEDLGKDGRALNEVIRQVTSDLPIPGAADAAAGFLDKVFAFTKNIKVDSDDRPGSLQLKISRGSDPNSGFDVEWTALDQVEKQDSDNRDPNNKGKRVFWLNGDGSKYRFWGSVH